MIHVDESIASHQCGLPQVSEVLWSVEFHEDPFGDLKIRQVRDVLEVNLGMMAPSMLPLLSLGLLLLLHADRVSEFV